MGGVSVPAVDTRFEARIRMWEEEALAPQATRSYPALRERPEEDCGLRDRKSVV